VKVLRVFLWFAAIGWAAGLGAKLFDSIVVAGTWSASLPATFALLPYRKRYPGAIAIGFMATVRAMSFPAAGKDG
jgi:hypothetical protein